MAFELPKLPYNMDAFGSDFSKETFEYHYGKHHQAYVKKLNAAVEGTDYANMSLEDCIIQSREKRETAVFNNAAQHYNHSFYWNCLTPDSTKPSSNLETAIKSTFGDMDSFKKTFTDSAAKLFGSGWAWLVKDDQGKVSMYETSNAENPIGTNYTPLLTCDVWEHAYYIDHRNARPNYLETFWNHINWDYVSKNYES